VCVCITSRELHLLPFLSFVLTVQVVVTSDQSHALQDHIAAEQESFNHIRQVTPMCIPSDMLVGFFEPPQSASEGHFPRLIRLREAHLCAQHMN